MTKTMTDGEMMNLAYDYVEHYLGDVCTGDEPTDAIYDEVYTLAFDALVDKDVSHATACSVAVRVAQRFAQP